MGRIQSSIGLISGVPIQDTVDKLISISARPRDSLIQRTKALQDQQVAIGELTALTIALQLSSDKLKSAEVYDARSVQSSNPEALSAAVTGSPAPGTYQFTPVRRATNNQLVSQGVASLDEPLGAGTIQLGFGGFIDQGLELAQLNGGAGVQRGKVRITDRSGESQVIDLRFAKTIDDVVQAINADEELNLVAEVDGDRLRLVDFTGQTLSNLRVQEVNGGTTAADLGLGNVDVAADSADGLDIVSLFGGQRLSRLNDGNGISFARELSDIQVDLADGTQLQIDFQATGQEEVTLDDLIASFNAADPARLEARISADGERVELVDLTSGGGSFQVSSINGSQVAEDLGLTAAAAGGVISGRKLIGGLKTTLLTTLNGGQGLGTLGQLSLTDRAGATATIDLSSVDQLDAVLAAINQASSGIQASLNSSRNGIELRDTSGGTGNLIVASADATNTAEALGLVVNEAVSQFNGGSLARQTVSESTLLSSLNGGKGVQLGSFLIEDSSGQTNGINLLVSGAETLGDVIDEINGLGLGVEARINEQGDGLLLIDTAGGGGKLTVTQSGLATTAGDLGILGTSESLNVGGSTVEGIQGSTRLQIDIASTDSLQDVIDKINDLDAGVIASVLNDGSADAPYRLSLVSQVQGSSGEIQVDGLNSVFSFQEIVQAQDALVLIGSPLAGGGLLASSSSNTFDNLVEGLEITVEAPTGQPVTIEVDESDQQLVSNLQLFVDSYNSLVDKLDSLTFFNELDNSTGILFGTHEALRVETDLANLLSGRFSAAGDLKSLATLGVQFQDTGKLDLDKDKLQELFQSNPDAVEEFFTTEQFGFVDRVNQAIDILAGEENSLLVSRNSALQRKIDSNNDRIEFMSGRLDRERERLLLDFFRMEESIAKIQSNLPSIEGIKPITV